jgi:GxxExxY protein
MNNANLKHRDLTQKLIGVFYEVYNELGHGFIESVYETALELVLSSKGIIVLRQIEVPVWFRGRKIGDFTADMLVEKVYYSRSRQVLPLILRTTLSC